MILATIVLLLAEQGASPQTPPMPPPPPVAGNYIMDVTDNPGEYVERNGTRWRERRTSYQGEYEISVLNISNDILRCHGRILFSKRGSTDGDSVVIVPQGKTWNIVDGFGKHGAKPKVWEVDCRPEPPVPPPPQPFRAECRSKDIHFGNPTDFYPSEERKLRHQGAVLVEYGLPETPGAPVEVVILQTSTYPAIDDAALQSLAASRGSSPCLGYRYRAWVKFTLQ